MSADELMALESDIPSYANFASPTQTLDVIKSDPSDNRILECAVTAKVGFIVSGDSRHVLPLGSYRGISTLRLGEFLKWLNRVH